MIRPLLLCAAAAGALAFSASADSVQTAAPKLQNETVSPSNDRVISLEASKRGMTRISFENDRAASVMKIGDGDPEGDFTATLDDATGDLYLVMGERAAPNLSFFVSTETGRTFQLLLRVADVPTRQVRISAPAEPDTAPEETELAAPAEPPRDPVVDVAAVLVRAMHSGARVDGFETKRFARLAWLEAALEAQGFRQTGVVAWEGNGATGYAVTIRNTTTEARPVDYRRLAVFNVVAASGVQDEIARRGTGRIFLVVKGGGQ